MISIDLETLKGTTKPFCIESKCMLFVAELENNRQKVIYETNVSFTTFSKKPITLVFPVPNKSGLDDDILISEETICYDIYDYLHDLKKYQLGIPFDKCDVCPKVLETKTQNPPDTVVCGNWRSLTSLLKTYWLSDQVRKELKDYEKKDFGFILVQLTNEWNNKTIRIEYTHNISHHHVLFVPSSLTSKRELIEVFSANAVLNMANKNDSLVSKLTWNIPISNDFVTKMGLLNYENNYISVTHLVSTVCWDTLAIDSIHNGWYDKKYDKNHEKDQTDSNIQPKTKYSALTDTGTVRIFDPFAFQGDTWDILPDRR